MDALRLLPLVQQGQLELHRQQWQQQQQPQGQTSAAERLQAGARFGGTAARGGAFGGSTLVGGHGPTYTIMGQLAPGLSRFSSRAAPAGGSTRIGVSGRTGYQPSLLGGTRGATTARAGQPQMRGMQFGGGAGAMGGIAFPRSAETTAYPLSTMSPQNMAAFQQAMGTAGTPSEWTPEGGTDPYTEQLISTMEETARAQFQENVLPSIQQRYAVRSATGSGAYQEEMARAETDLERQIAENAAAMRYQTHQAALSRDLQAWMHEAASGNTQLQAALQAANIPMFAYYVQPGQTGAQALGAYGAGYTGGFRREASFI